jgi:hypothetical protein
VVSWCVALDDLWARWNGEFRASWLGGQPDDALSRVRYTKTAYFGGQPEETTDIGDLQQVANDAIARIDELVAMRPGLHLDV